MSTRSPARPFPAAAVLALALVLAACTSTTPDWPQAGAPTSISSPDATFAPTTAGPTHTAASALPTVSTLPTVPSVPSLPPGAAPPTLVDLGIDSASTGSFGPVETIGVQAPSGERLWVAHTTGMRNFTPGEETAHTVAVLAREGDRWRVIDRMILGGEPNAPDAAATPDYEAYGGPDYLGMGGVAQTAIEPTHLWLTVDGGIGAHSGSFALLSFDGSRLAVLAHASNSFQGVGHIEDLDGDGVAEVVIDATDPYVFCYACGVREARVDILQWDGAEFQSLRAAINLMARPTVTAADRDTLDANAWALEAAAGGLWQAAVAAIDEAVRLAPDDPNVRRNALWIRANADALRRFAEDDDGAPYPILHRMFYGDWIGAVEPFRAYPPERTFAPDSPLIVGTAAEHGADAIAERVAGASRRVLTSPVGLPPHLTSPPETVQAAAHFLRGWSAWIARRNIPAARTDIAKSAELAPDDALYTASAAWIAAHP